MSPSSETNDPKQLRQFGLIMAGMVISFFALLIPLIWEFALPLWPWVVAALFAALALSAPRLLQPVYVVWMKVGAILGWINTRLILGVVFFLIFVPIGIVIRTVKDPLRRKLHEPIDTYRIKSKQPSVGNLERPF